MSGNDRGEERYFPTEEELRFLIHQLIKYFNLSERSALRRNAVEQAHRDILRFNPTHWTPVRVRLSFNNNKSSDVNKDPQNEFQTLNCVPPRPSIQSPAPPIPPSTPETEFPELPQVPECASIDQILFEF
jgi:hypothetical protein